MSDPAFSGILIGELISKKNAWKPGRHGGVYLDKAKGRILDGFIRELQSLRNKARLGKPLAGDLRLEAIFYVKTLRTDLDNIFTTLCDLLQKAKIIENDRHIYDFSVRREMDKKNPRVEVSVYQDD